MVCLIQSFAVPLPWQHQRPNFCIALAWKSTVASREKVPGFHAMLVTTFSLELKKCRLYYSSLCHLKISGRIYDVGKSRVGAVPSLMCGSAAPRVLASPAAQQDDGVGGG